MDNDDLPVGRLLSRREALALIGAASAAMLTACGGNQPGSTATTNATSAAASLNPEAATAVATATANPGANTTAVAASTMAELPTCIVTPEQTVGPYYADVQLNRADIRSDTTSGEVKEGTLFDLNVRVSQISASSCTPVQGALVELWHCDAAGVYSAFAQEGTANQNFLRGHQVTDANGQVRFITIYPGWYRGRTIHIHFRVLTTGTNGQEYEFTSQLYFDDTVSDEILAQAPYAANGHRDQTNASDGIYNQGGDQLTVAVAKAGEGYTGNFHIGLDLADTSVGAADTMGGPRR